MNKYYFLVYSKEDNKLDRTYILKSTKEQIEIEKDVLKTNEESKFKRYLQVTDELMIQVIELCEKNKALKSFDYISERIDDAIEELEDMRMAFDDEVAHIKELLK